MKILHTSDWHLGHRWMEFSQYEEQKMFLDWLKIYIQEEEIEVLLVAGDIFDTGVPSTQSQKLYYDFLIDLRQTSCQHIVITAGNHDAPGTINAPKALLHSLSIYVLGKASENIEDELIELSVGNENLLIAAVPYLRDQDIRRALAGESSTEIENRYKTALTNHYLSIAEVGKQRNIKPFIAMGHLFAIGGKTSESEQSIYVGNLGDISAQDFPSEFDYIALGHLHRAQKVAKQENIRYSGSPYTLSFSEQGQLKKLIQIETKGESIQEIKEIEIPTFREIERVSGNLEDCISQLQSLSKTERKLELWVEVILDSKDHPSANDLINRTADSLNLQVLKITIKGSKERKGLEELLEKSKEIRELDPMEVFKMKCEEDHYELKDHPEIKDAFTEILNLVRESD
jgi:exonuclease SbcD